jgi:hypothetical protein
MTSVPAHHTHDAHHAPPDLSPANVTLPYGSGRGLGMGLMAAGVLVALVTAALGMSGVAGTTLTHWVAVYHVGAMSVLGMCLGALFFLMAFHLTNAGWSVTIRRQFENIASFIPFAVLLVLPVLVIEMVTHGRLFLWMNHSQAGDHLMEHKRAYFYLNQPVGGFPVFFVLRAVLYVALWTYLARRLCKLSRQQDESGDATLSEKARFTSAWGMLAFALSVAFASFDWLMSMDYKFFSTMWGVYYFAGAAFACTGLVVLVLSRLLAAGRLKGVVTAEHFHDLGKLMFSFTVFWAYIAFFQYFLIWYSNIPEETAFYVYRDHAPWRNLGIFLMVGHFGAPFVILLFRGVKRSFTLLSLVAVWVLFIQLVDIYWIVRPMVNARAALPESLFGSVWFDAAAALAPLALLAGYLCTKVPATALIPMKDPRLQEALNHRNYV